MGALLPALQSYPYQEDIIKRSLSTKDNVLVMLPTGGGKTHIASEIAGKINKTLFLAPKISLLDQTVESFQHLNPQTIHGKTKYDKNKNVFVSTIQTMSRRPELLSSMDFDTIIIDEVHFGNSGKMQEVIKSNHSGNFIGLSATPYDIEGKLLEGYETIIDTYDMKYLIDRKYLTPVEAVCPFKVDLKGVKIVAGDYDVKELDYRMSSPEMIALTVNSTVKIIKKKNKIVVFCVSIEHAEKVAKAYRKVFKANGVKKKIKTLHSKIKKDTQKEILAEFAAKDGDIDMLISVDMITTGFNVPAIDCMVIARPTKSQNLYKQMVGRGTRNYPGKKYCLMIDCGNVVENLGMPLDPIRIIEKEKRGETKGPKPCPDCGEKKPKRIVEDGKGGLLKVCSSCGGDEEEYVGDYIDQCDNCNFMHTYISHEKNYIINEYGIALKCKGCNNISALSFFESPDDNRAFIQDYDINHVIIDHIMSKRSIFFIEAFVEHTSNLILKKKKTFINLLFSNKENIASLLMEKIGKEINKKEYTRSVNSLSRRILRSLFVEFCHRYLKLPKEELELRIIKTEDLYFDKKEKEMNATMYEKSARHYVKYIKEQKNIKRKPIIKEKMNKTEQIKPTPRKKNIGQQQKFDF